MDIQTLQRYCENNRLKFKRTTSTLPRSFWETYPSLANTDGGVIVLGATERPDSYAIPTGISNPDAMLKDLWSGLDNEQKVSTNLPLDSDMAVEVVDGRRIPLVRVSRADETLHPAYINDNPKRGSYRRDGKGDYHCKTEEFRAMTCDSAERATDKLVLANIDIDALSQESIHAYRAAFDGYGRDRPWSYLKDEEFLLRLGAIGRSPEAGEIHPTRAGLLMFGEAWRITDEYPDHFLDCHLVRGGRRWEDRVISGGGGWSGNVYDFYRRAQRMIVRNLPIPFGLDEGMYRVSDTPQHRALREVLVNSPVHADYYGRMGVVVVRRPGYAKFSNPGDLRLPADVVEGDGISDSCNLTLFMMFSLIGLSDKAGDGFDVYWRASDYAHVEQPIFEEHHESDRVSRTIRVSADANVGNHVGDTRPKPCESEHAVLNQITAAFSTSAKDIAGVLNMSDKQV